MGGQILRDKEINGLYVRDPQVTGDTSRLSWRRLFWKRGREGLSEGRTGAVKGQKEEHLNVRLGTCTAAKRRRKKCY